MALTHRECRSAFGCNPRSNEETFKLQNTIADTLGVLSYDQGIRKSKHQTIPQPLKTLTSLKMNTETEFRAIHCVCLRFATFLGAIRFPNLSNPGQGFHLATTTTVDISCRFHNVKLSFFGEIKYVSNEVHVNFA